MAESGPKSISVSLRKHDKKRWGALQYFGNVHLVCAEKLVLKDQSYSFLGGHRVRLYKLTGNVNWTCADAADFEDAGLSIDISAVPVQKAPARRKQGR